MAELSMTPSAVRSRAKREKEREALGKQRRNWTPVADDARAVPRHIREREARMELKRRQRATFAAMTRPHDAHVKAWQSAPKPPLHDAHVRALNRDKPAYFRWRTANDPAFRLNTRMRVQIRKALRGLKRGRRWETLLGYTLDELVDHLRKMLPSGMSLSQCIDDGWHIDHILPKSGFDCSSIAELKAAWALPNPRLVPADVNLRKSDSREFLL